MSRVYPIILVFIVATLLFFWALHDVGQESRCPNKNSIECFEANGRYRHKGRGSDEDDVQTLLNRIDWLGKNGHIKYLYSTSYISAYLITLAVFFILFGFVDFFPTEWEIILILLVSFLISYSVTAVIGFHDDRYPYYYIRNNVKLIQDKMNWRSEDPPKPKTNYVPHRTVIRDILDY